MGSSSTASTSVCISEVIVCVIVCVVWLALSLIVRLRVIKVQNIQLVRFVNEQLGLQFSQRFVGHGKPEMTKHNFVTLSHIFLIFIQK